MPAKKKTETEEQAKATTVAMRPPPGQRVGGWNNPATGEVTVYEGDETGTCAIPGDRVAAMLATGWSVPDGD